MKIALRLFGLDIFELEIETDEDDDKGPGDSTTNSVGFTLPAIPAELDMPQRAAPED